VRGLYLIAIPFIVTGLVFEAAGCVRRPLYVPALVLLLCTRSLWDIASGWMFRHPFDAVRPDADAWTARWFAEWVLPATGLRGLLAWMMAVFMLCMPGTWYFALSAALVLSGGFLVVFAGVRTHRMNAVGQIRLLATFEATTLRRARSASRALAAAGIIGLGCLASCI
jgi:hypothetical protein